ncbi:MAG: tRNA (adenosine(37)-N6)-threonylcarbamoyltransferase complex ATPase subunit type 1 TsaE [Endomicrobia bacterium]|nr:tRNA (adenosine(37)-N6)-threonylcarbamoyltransferase complex ATPase subunit type 1 TsaE [Endomicrobiia bacterium]
MCCFYSSSVGETHEIAASVLDRYICDENKVIVLFLYGQLGSGKTEFVKGIAKKLKFSKKEVKSPSFNLFYELINKKFILSHIDLYRINSHYADDFVLDFFKEMNLEKKNVVCIEWPDRLLKKTIYFFKKFFNVVTVKIKMLKNNKRKISVMYKNEKT